MNPETAVELIKSLILNSVALASPILMTALTIGLGVSVFQAVTSIHEQTLSFLPKLVGVMLLLAVASGWMIQKTVDYASRSFERIATVGP